MSLPAWKPLLKINWLKNKDKYSKLLITIHHMLLSPGIFKFYLEYLTLLKINSSEMKNLLAIMLHVKYF